MTPRLDLLTEFRQGNGGLANYQEWPTSAHNNRSQCGSSGSQDLGASTIKHDTVPEPLFRDESLRNPRYLVPPSKGVQQPRSCTLLDNICGDSLEMLGPHEENRGRWDGVLSTRNSILGIQGIMS